MSGSATDWVRLAELRENAADEEWAQQHPIRAALRAKLKRLRIWTKLAAQDFRQSERGQRLLAQFLNVEQGMWSLVLRCYLLSCRVVGCRPSRLRMVRDLSTKRLLDELARRGVDTTDFVEREELLEALCGPPNDAETAAEAATEHAIMTVDKMV